MIKMNVYTICEYRKMQGISQNEVGRLSGNHPSNMSRLNDAGKCVAENAKGKIKLIDKDLADFLREI
jgi:hypothetical protein